MLALLHTSSPYLALRSCRGRDLVRANSFDASAPALEEVVQLVLTDPPYNFRRVEKSKNSAHSILSFSDINHTPCSLRTYCSPLNMQFFSAQPRSLPLTTFFVCAQVHARQRLVLIVCVDIKRCSYGKHCCVAVCEEPLLPLQIFCKKPCAGVKAVTTALHLAEKWIFCSPLRN